MIENGVMFVDCGHIVCGEHIEQLMQDLDGKCPICRKSIQQNRIVQLGDVLRSNKIDKKHRIVDIAPEHTKLTRKQLYQQLIEAASQGGPEPVANQGNSNNSNSSNKSKNKDSNMNNSNDNSNDNDNNIRNVNSSIEDDEWLPSTKTRLLLDRLKQIRRTEPNCKILVYSQFTSFLKLCEPPLKQNKIKYLKYTGSLTMTQREAMLKEFNDENSGVYVMLMSLKCASLGLNLSIANRVIFLDLWWNPQIESQATDRVHRIGQKKTVYVERLIIKNSIEEKIMELQQHKKNVADAALDGRIAGAGPSGNGLNFRDFGRLFNEM